MKKQQPPRLGFDKGRGWYVALGIVHPEGGKTHWVKQYVGKHSLDWSQRKAERETATERHLLWEAVQRGEVRHPAASTTESSSAQHPTLEEAVWRAIVAQEGRDVGEQMRRISKNMGTTFLDWAEAWRLCDNPAGSFAADDARRFLDELQAERRWTGKTRNNYQGMLGILFGYLHERGIISANPWHGLKRAKEQPVGTHAVYSGPGRPKLLALIQQDPDLWRSVALLYYAGLRFAEQARLQVADLDLEAQRIRVVGKKTRKVQYVQMPDALADVLQQQGLGLMDAQTYLFSLGLRPGLAYIEKRSETVAKRHRKLATQAGFGKNHTWYSWKHTAAVDLARAGFSMKAIHDHFRHHSLDMTERYLRDLGVLQEHELRTSYPPLGGG